MRSWWCFVVLVVCLSDQTFSQSFEFEEIVPVKISGRSSRRVSKRSEEQPSFRLTAFGRDFTLHLYPDNSFLAPTLQIKRIKTKEFSKTDRTADSQDSLHLPVIDSERINQTDEADGDIRRCFYTGTVDFSEDSVVAVSLCHGILGTFITGGDEYFIEPKLFGTGTNKGLAEQLHVVKRRNSTERQNDSKRLLTEMSGGDYKGYGLFIQNTHLLQDKAAGQKPLRHRRFVSTPRFIETLVVADSSLVQFYGDDVKHYVLTLMSVVAQIYKHPSVKNSVNVVVVKMLLVEDEDMGPSISSNGGVALRNFCSWQQLFNPTSQRHPEHYDTAVLFTREDICGHQSCDTLGVADVGTMCDSKKSCSVIEDNGLQAAFTAAHELGHVLSMPHDDSKICERLFGPIGKHHVMAPVFVHLNKTSPWSACSAFYVTEFFDKGHGDCLLDRPEEFLPLPKELPGMTYSLDQQCQQIFGEEFAHCPNISDSDVCSQLWCKKDGQSLCTTRNGSLPWADGTACAPNRACLNSACMPAEEVFRPREPVNGDWGEWGPWQECSRTCGGGIMFSYRECTNPVPQNGGKYCEGQRVRYQSCNTPACADKHGKSFREEQCEKYNSYNYLDIHGNVKRWIPKYAGVPPRDRCKLFCRARGSSEFKVFESKVIDGTTCGPDTTSICVQGQCIKAGCDKEIGSNKKLDKCGVCGGNGLSCRKISGSFNKAFYGYNDIVTIPSGATNIDIKQRSHRGIKHDGYYLAVKKEDGVYILNGNFSVSTVEQDIPVLGAVIKYSGSSTTLERIQSFHQLREAITIQLLSTAGDFTPPKVKYTFFIPKDVSFSKRTDQRTSVHMIHPFGVPQWVLGEWSECSRSCGSGWSRRNVECKDNAGFYSNHCDKDLKPIDIRPCGDIPCPIWQMGPWSSCSQTCGQGQRRRSVFCIDHTGKIVESEKCDPAKQPKPVSGECIYQDC